MAKTKIISTKEITKVLSEFSYEANPAMYHMIGEHVWFPTKEPIDLMLPSKAIRMSELVPIRTISELKNLIKSKLNK